MSIAGVVYDVWEDSFGDRSELCLGVEITPDQPSAWARHPCFRTPLADPRPIAPGDRVTVPVHSVGGHATRVDGVKLRMLGGLYDRDAPRF